MSIYRFSKGGRLFVQGTREGDARENVPSPVPTASTPVADDLTAIYTKRRLSTEVLGRIVGCPKSSVEIREAHFELARSSSGDLSGLRTRNVVRIGQRSRKHLLDSLFTYSCCFLAHLWTSTAKLLCEISFKHRARSLRRVASKREFLRNTASRAGYCEKQGALSKRPESLREVIFSCQEHLSNTPRNSW